MSLLHLDGFYYTSSDLGTYYEYSGGLAYIGVYSGGRRVDGRYSHAHTTGGSGNYVGKRLYTDGALADTIIAGSAHYITNTGTDPFFSFRNSSGTQINIYADMTGRIYVKNDAGTLLGQTDELVHPVLQWVYVECKVYVHSTAGSVEVKLNGVTVILLENINTQSQVTSGIDRVYRYTLYYDITDYYICDTLGTDNNDFIGDIRIDCIRPDGAGFSSDWNPSSGDNYECVDGIGGDTATYNNSSTPDAVDLYSLDNLSALGTTIKGIQLASHAKKTDAGNKVIKGVLRTNSINYLEDTEWNLTDTFVWRKTIFERNPDDDDVWLESEINNLESGMKLIS